MTRDELLALPPTLDVPKAAEVLDIGRTLAYELVRTNRWPTPVLRVGNLIKIPTAPLLRLLNDPDPASALSGGNAVVSTGIAPEVDATADAGFDGRMDVRQ